MGRDHTQSEREIHCLLTVLLIHTHTDTSSSLACAFSLSLSFSHFASFCVLWALLGLPQKKPSTDTTVRGVAVTLFLYSLYLLSPTLSSLSLSLTLLLSLTTQIFTFLSSAPRIRTPLVDKPTVVKAKHVLGETEERNKKRRK